MLKMSVVTVCYQAEKSIEKTIQSVIQQDYPEKEYWIIDGGSTDKTIDIISEYAKKYSCIKWISEPDKGIYNAMNKAVQYVTGEYVYYLNCGDLFSSDSVLTMVAQKAECHPADIIYGDIIVQYTDSKKRAYYVKWKRMNSFLIALGITICHQAVFTRRDLLHKKGFDEEFELWADQEFFMYWMKKQCSIGTINICVCDYDAYGVSASGDSLERVFIESDRITKKYTPVVYYLTVLPKALLRVYRRAQRRKNGN